MKKLLTIFAVIFVLAFAGAAFAAEGGHGGHVADNYKPIVITSSDVTLPSGVSVDNVETIDKTAAATDSTYLPQAGSSVPNVAGGLKLDLSHDPNVSGDITLTVSGLSGINKAWISKKGAANEYLTYNATTSGDKITIMNVSFDAHFSKANVYVGSYKSIDSGGSSGGCNAGFAGLLLFAAIPLLNFRKK